MVNMKKKLACLLLAAFTVLGCALPAAADSTEIQTYSVPVTLTAAHSAKHINVTLPASMPVSYTDGKVLTASNLKIENHADSVNVQVSAVEVRSGSFSVVSYNSFPAKGGERIALRINGCATEGPGALALTASAFPVISTGQNLPIQYQAKVAMPDNDGSFEAAYVVFTLKAV